MWDAGEVPTLVTTGWNTIHANATRAYRYLRFVSSNYYMCVLGEIQFLGLLQTTLGPTGCDVVVEVRTRVTSRPRP